MEETLIINELIAKTADIDLADLPMSIRLYNCLRRGGYATLTDVMIEAPDKFSQIRNFGKTSEQELMTIIQFARTASREQILDYCQKKGMGGIPEINSTQESVGADEPINDFSGFTISEYVLGKRIDFSSVMFQRDSEDYCEDISFTDLELSTRTYNGLIAHGVSSLRELASMKYRELIQISGFGQKSIDEVLETVKRRIVINESKLFYDEEEVKDAVARITDFFSVIIENSFIKAKEKEITIAVINVLNRNDKCKVDNQSFMLEMAKVNPINSLLRDVIKDSVSERFYQGIDKGILLSLVSRQNRQYEYIIEAVLEDMILTNQVREVSGKLYKYKVFLNEWVDSLEGNSRIVIEGRCKGMTLEEIGNQIGLTRERVRQLITKALRKCPTLYEEDYAIFIEKYDFEREEFSTLFSLDSFQVNYLLFAHKRGVEDVQTFLNDNMVPSAIKERVPVAFKGKVIILDGECIPLKRDVLLKTLLKTFYSEAECTVEEFADFYQAFLKENELDDRENLLFPNSRAFEARITDYPYSLMKAGHKIRYYDTEDVDLDSLFEAIDIHRYQNMEISTLKLMRDWQDVMEQYDIRDEYELHNLIRKRIADAAKYEISVTRMPFITIGDGDRVKQVEELLLQMAPISNIDLAKAYEEMYGVRSETVLANFFKPIDVYYHNGLFDLEQQELREEEYLMLRSVLTEDVYLWDEIVKKYRELSKCPKLDAINAMTLKKLGFKVYSQYVISSSYPSADAFFTSILEKDRCVDLNEFKQGIRSIQAFYAALSDLRDSLELIEVDRDVFYRFDYFAEKYAVNSKEELLAIGQEVLSRLDDTEYFSVEATAKSTILEDLPIINNNAYILNSIIRAQEGYKTSQIANAYIATRKDYDLSQLGLITHITNKNGGISIRDLISTLRSDYELFLDKSRVVYVLQESKELIYDDIFDYIVLASDWHSETGAVYLGNSRFAKIIIEKQEEINRSSIMIANYYWNDKYTEFVEYCGLNDCFLMRDLLKLDFRKLSDNSSRLNISKGTIADIVGLFIEWVQKLSETEEDNSSNESIMDLFFK